MDIKFDSELACANNDKCIKSKIKTYRDKVNTNIQGKTVPKKNHDTNVCHW